MANPKSHAVLASPVLSSLSDAEIEAITRWLDSAEGRESLMRAAEEAREAIDELNKSRRVSLEEMQRPICLRQAPAGP
jgi:hypothetical protein